MAKTSKSSSKKTARSTSTGRKSPVAPPSPQTGDTTAIVDGILAWENDPFAHAMPPATPVTGTPVPRPVPDLASTKLPISIVGAAPPAARYAVGTKEFRFWTAAEALRRCADFWSGLLPQGTTWHPQVGKSLRIGLDMGTDLNAYYDRKGLQFFHDTVGGMTVYSGESPDILCHEMGHAVLDAIRPQLFNVAYDEVAAFHEAFGDVSSILSSLQIPSFRERILSETGGKLYQSSRLSRLAEQLGWAIRRRRPDAADPDCLRNAVNSFFYQNPSTLPPSGPAYKLTSEPHSFSRVFTGAFFEALAGMMRVHESASEETLLKLSREIGRLIIQGVRGAPIVPAYYSQVAAAMVRESAVKYRDALTSAFVRHGILSLEAAAATRGRRRQRGVAGEAAVDTERFMIAESMDSAVAASSGEGGYASILCPEYGLRNEAVQVYMPNETPRFSVAGAALDRGSTTPPGDEEAAKYFIEDLFRRGRVQLAPSALPETEEHHPFAHPFSRKTHVLSGKRNSLVLERVIFDCGFDSE